MHPNCSFHFLMHTEFSNRFDGLQVLIVSVVDSGMFVDDPSFDRSPEDFQVQETFFAALTKANAFVPQTNDGLLNSLSDSYGYRCLTLLRQLTELVRLYGLRICLSTLSLYWPQEQIANYECNMTDIETALFPRSTVSIYSSLEFVWGRFHQLFPCYFDLVCMIQWSIPHYCWWRHQQYYSSCCLSRANISTHEFH